MNNGALKRMILGNVAAACCMACPAAEQQTPPGEVRAGHTNLVVIREHQGPVIGPDHPDVKATDNRSGFETGEVISTGKMKDKGFSAVGKCTLAWASK
jgi:hypothetical protein